MNPEQKKQMLNYVTEAEDGTLFMFGSHKPFIKINGARFNGGVFNTHDKELAKKLINCYWMGRDIQFLNKMLDDVEEESQPEPEKKVLGKEEESSYIDNIEEKDDEVDLHSMNYAALKSYARGIGCEFDYKKVKKAELMKLIEEKRQAS